MAIGNIWKMHSIVLVGAGPPANAIIGSMQSVAMPTDTEIVREVNAGQIYAKQVHQNFRSASINYTSWNLQDLLDVVGLAGRCIPDASYTDVHVYIAKYDCNQIASGSVHTRYEVNKGIIYPTSLTVDHQGNAQISYSIMAIYDGSNAPIVKAVNQALPTIPAGQDDRWTMYDAHVNNILVAQKKSINIDFGPQTNTEGADSEAFDSWVSLDAVLPTITIQGINPEYLAAAGPVTTLAGNDYNNAAVNRVRLKKRGIAIGTAEHIIINTQGLARISEPFNSTGNDAGRTELRFEAIQEDTNVPLIFQTDVAIS